MGRIETKIMDGWEFSISGREGVFKPILLPHDWVIENPININMEYGESQGFRERWSIGYYKRNLQIVDKDPSRLYYLYFGGVFENCTIWVNGFEVGTQKYGYSPFTINITDVINTGNNKIELKVDNTQRPVDRWYSGAGIYRTVKLIDVEKKHFDKEKIFIKTKIDNDNAIINVQTGVSERVIAELKGYGSSLEVEGNEVLEIVVQKPKLWSAETPNLYSLNLKLYDNEKIFDQISIKIGIREVSINVENGVVVNGNPIKLKGVCLHQEVGCRGIASTKEIWTERLKNFKQMGCNTVRPSHHIFSEEFLDLCDEMGFYVYEECFDKWTGGLYGRYFDEEWRNDLESMILRDRNRPSIIIWGVGNEVENQAQGSMVEILGMLTKHARTLDGTRPLSYAMNPHFKKENNIDISTIKDIQKFVDEEDDLEIYDNDERVNRIKRIAEHVDIVSCNYMEQWYDMIHEAIPNKPILGTEVFQFFKGHVNQLQNYCDSNPAFVPIDKDYVIGSLIWSGYDYLGESMGWPAKGWGGALIRTNNTKRFGYYLLKSFWSKEPMVHFAVMDYSLQDEGVKSHWDAPMYVEHWHFPQYVRTVIPFMIASNCEKVRLFLNGKEYFLLDPVEYPNKTITGYLPWEPGVVEAVGYINEKEVSRHILKTPEMAVNLEFEKKEHYINNNDLTEILLNVYASDSDNNPCFRESAYVRFRIEGEAEIIGVDNGNMMSHEMYNEEAIHMYRGTASVQLRIYGKSGRVVVYADSDGMFSGEMTIIINNR